ncbi:MAG: 50S ribosome-binding GTPase [Anaerolineales bacterium]|nr:50S ribosome-binding GTPase [Anaerolineales bacterium]
MTEKRIHVALAGNPNTGKSTVFNALTGSHQHVGNWPGKTVEKKEGEYSYGGVDVQVIDLPGTYSLSYYSLEEQIARDYIIKNHPDVVVNVVDCSNLERNLYLTVQILETHTPVILFLNMEDQAHVLGYKIDHQELSRRLNGIIVIPGTASKYRGIRALQDAILEFTQQNGISEEPAFATPGNERLLHGSLSSR